MGPSSTAYRVIRWLYSALYFPLAPFIGIYLLARPDSRKRWKDYLALAVPALPDPAPGRRIWLHAVSVGEVLSALPIIEQFQTLAPGTRVVLTSTIEDALAMARHRGVFLEHARFLPLDLGPLMGRLLTRLNPDLIMISETDFWPNMLEAARCADVPVYLINGRISYKIHNGYAVFKNISREIFGRLTRAFVQSEQDRQRLLDLGVESARIRVAGNTKYEASLACPELGQDEPLLDALLLSGRERTIVAGSTHPGEESPLLELMVTRGDLRLILVPRRVERSKDLVIQSRRRGLETLTWQEARSNPDGLDGQWSVLVIDVIGVLARLYEAGRVAFVGGSFDGSGGHNFLEAARVGIPFVIGPAMRNFHEDVDRFLQADALTQVDDLESLPETLTRLLDDDASRQMGERAGNLLRKNEGAARSSAEAILMDFRSRQAPRVRTETL